MTLAELKEQLEQYNLAAQDLRAKAEAEKRDLTEQEASDLDSTLEAFDRCKQNIDRLERLDAQTQLLTQSSGQQVARTQPGSQPSLSNVDDEDDPAPKPGRKTAPSPRVSATLAPRNGGFRNFGEMAKSVALACRHGGITDPRLQSLASASTYGSEGSGADGGFAVPPEFRNAIMEQVMAESSLLSRCDQITTGGNSFTCPWDSTTPWQNSGGILAAWDGEAIAATQSKPQLEERSIKLNKIRALVPMTEELLEDASAMDAYLRRKAPAKIDFKVSLAIVQGTGVGQPLGILKSPSLVTVSKEGSQVADTLVGNNVIKMYSRMYAPNRANAVWLINQDIEPQLYKLALPGTDNTGNAVTGWGGLVYMPPGGLNSAPYGTLLGRPVISTQACETLGDLGDILFVDLSQYLALIKSGVNPRVDTSIHLWFDQDLTAFKFTLRIGGMPWWSSTVAARDGSTTYSPFVALEAR